MRASWAGWESEINLTAALAPTAGLNLTLEILGRTSLLLLPQYATKRHHLTYATAALLDSHTSLTSLLLLLVILPATSQLLLSTFSLSARKKDLRLAQVSAILAAAGVMSIGLADTETALIAGVVIAGLGTGYTSLVRGLMTAVVGGREIGMLYTSIAVVETGAGLVAGPVWNGLFRVGLGWGDGGGGNGNGTGAWVGLPFVVAGWVLVAAAGVVGVVGRGVVVGDGKGGDDDRGGERGGLEE